MSILAHGSSSFGRKIIRNKWNLRLGALAIARSTLRDVSFLAAAVMLMVPGAGHAGSSQCTGAESVLFACRIGKNVASVCASQLSAGAAQVQYRFGPKHSPTVNLPRAGSDWREEVSVGVLTFAGGGGAYVPFKNGPYRYVVYTAIGRGWGEKAGVSVEKNGKRVRNLPCSRKPVSELGPDLFYGSGFPQDPAGFDLP